MLKSCAASRVVGASSHNGWAGKCTLGPANSVRQIPKEISNDREPRISIWALPVAVPAALSAFMPASIHSH